MHKLFLHVGGGKTGTTAIQYYFFNNPNSGDLQYLPVGLQNQGHHGIAAALMGEAKFDWLQAYSSERLMDEIGSLGRLKSTRLLVSSEVFSSTGFICSGGIHKLRKLFDIWDITVIYFVRNQLDLVESSFLQLAKTGAFVEDIYKWYKEFKKREIGEYVSKLEVFREVFGSEKVAVISFDDHRGDILAPIACITKVKIDRSKIERANKSSLVSSLVLQSFSRDTGKRLIGPDAFKLRCIAENILADNEKYTLISEKLAKHIILDFHEENTKLQKLCGVDLNHYHNQFTQPKVYLNHVDLEEAKVLLFTRLTEKFGGLENTMNPQSIKNFTFDHRKASLFSDFVTWLRKSRSPAEGSREQNQEF